MLACWWWAADGASRSYVEELHYRGAIIYGALHACLEGFGGVYSRWWAGGRSPPAASPASWLSVCRPRAAGFFWASAPLFPFSLLRICLAVPFRSAEVGGAAARGCAFWRPWVWLVVWAAVFALCGAGASVASALRCTVRPFAAPGPALSQLQQRFLARGSSKAASRGPNCGCWRDDVTGGPGWTSPCQPCPLSLPLVTVRKHGHSFAQCDGCLSSWYSLVITPCRFATFPLVPPTQVTEQSLARPHPWLASSRIGHMHVPYGRAFRAQPGTRVTPSRLTEPQASVYTTRHGNSS